MDKCIVKVASGILPTKSRVLSIISILSSARYVKHFPTFIIIQLPDYCVEEKGGKELIKNWSGSTRSELCGGGCEGFLNFDF